jgi:hypothetical protein
MPGNLYLMVEFDSSIPYRNSHLYLYALGCNFNIVNHMCFIILFVCWVISWKGFSSKLVITLLSSGDVSTNNPLSIWKYLSVTFQVSIKGLFYFYLF